MSRIGRGLPGILIVLVLAGAPRASADDSPLPWKPGDQTAGGWSVAKLQRHAEFIRLSMTRGTAAACVEVRYRQKEDPPAWSTRDYRIQPCPRAPADEPLLRELLEQLRDWELAREHVRFVKQTPESWSAGPGGGPQRPPLIFYPTAFYTGLNCLALLLFLGLVAFWLRRYPQDRPVAVAGALLAAGAVGAVLLLWDPSEIPAGWVTILHEGYGYQNVMHLSGSGVHAENNFLVLQELWAGVGAYYSGSVVLRATVLVNICLALAGTGLFFVVAFVMSRKLWIALLFSFFLAANINFIHAVASETPALLLFVYFLMSTLPAALLNDRENTGWLVAGLAVFDLVLLGVLICATRFDMIVLVLPALLAGFIQLFNLGPRIRRLLSALWRWTRGNWRWLLPAALVLAAASTAWWAGYHHRGDPRIAWAIDGLFPFNPSFLTPPWFLAVYLPLGLVLLIVLGFIGGFRGLIRTYFLPLSILVLWRTYYSATHGWGGPFYERFRFLTYLTPVFIFLALHGSRELGRWVAGWPWLRARARAAAVVLGLLFLVWWPPGWGGHFNEGHDLPGLPHQRLLMSRNQQTEVRYMLDLMDRYPDCAFITRTIKHDDVGKPQYLWGLFGKKVRTDLFFQKPGETLWQVSQDRAPANPCVFFYYGLDCQKQTGDGCREEIKNRAVLEEHQLKDLPYTDYHGGDSHPPIIRLAVLRVR